MKRNLIRSTLVLMMFGVVLVGSFRVWHTASAASAYVALAENTVPLIHDAQVTQDTSADQQLSLSISLQMRNEPLLDTLLEQLYTPGSLLYHRFLTPQQFDGLFAPDTAQVQQVVSYLQSQGLTVTGVAANHLLIDASGTVAQAQQAFKVHIQNYRMGKLSFFANNSAPLLPPALQPLIAAVSGLDNSIHLQPAFQRQARLLADPPGYGPQDLLNAYDIGPLRNMGLLGDGQTVALFELDGYQPNDIVQYMQQYSGTTVPIHPVLVSGVNGSAGGGAVEVEMDMEIIAGIAPHATQLVYEGPNSNQGINDTYNRIVSENKAQVVSISWGICEAVTGAGELKTLDNIFKQGVAQGISFFAAAGDSGAYDCKDQRLGVDSPASDPYVTAVGGTTLQRAVGPGEESVWSDPSDTLRAPHGSGGGGGLSSTFKQPKWQSAPGVKNRYSNGYREVPDIAANADPGTGYSVYCTVHNAGCPPDGWLSLGGTSAAAPVWAASTLLVNQYLHNKGKARIGFANPALYSLASSNNGSNAFNDITDGNNLYYPATPNYDLATGLGTPDVYALAQALGA